MSKWLYAATLDRWLVSQGNLQKYGTQFRHIDDGTYIQLPVDGTISDKQREECDIAPLTDLQKEKR